MKDRGARFARHSKKKDVLKITKLLIIPTLSPTLLLLKQERVKRDRVGICEKRKNERLQQDKFKTMERFGVNLDSKDGKLYLNKIICDFNWFNILSEEDDQLFLHTPKTPVPV